MGSGLTVHDGGTVETTVITDHGIPFAYLDIGHVAASNSRGGAGVEHQAAGGVAAEERAAELDGVDG